MDILYIPRFNPVGNFFVFLDYIVNAIKYFLSV